jgi:hypothetical protein
LRLAWNLLNVSDPSTRTLLFEESGGAQIGTRTSDGFRIGAVIYRRSSSPSLLGALPPIGSDRRWHADQFSTWEWKPWTTPRYHQRLKPVYDSLKSLWGRK